MIRTKFQTGGYAIHKVAYGNLKVSAWYDSHGGIIDCEAFDRLGRSRYVKPDGPLHQHLKSVGKIWRYGR